MSRATVELDFFGMEKDNSSFSSHSSNSSSKSQFQKFIHRQRSFGGIQSAISKINPEVLKSVIASASVNQSFENVNLIPSKNSASVPSSPNGEQILFPALPVYTPPSLRLSSEVLPDTAPLTIFYNGAVAVFDVHRDKAENILKLAMEGASKAVEDLDPKAASGQQQLLDTLNGGVFSDLPIARTKSLQRFLEKRKERLTSGSPYACYT